MVEAERKVVVLLTLFSNNTRIRHQVHILALNKTVFISSWNINLHIFLLNCSFNPSFIPFLRSCTFFCYGNLFINKNPVCNAFAFVS